MDKGLLYFMSDNEFYKKCEKVKRTIPFLYNYEFPSITDDNLFNNYNNLCCLFSCHSHIMKRHKSFNFSLQFNKIYPK